MISLDPVNSPSCQALRRRIVKLNINFLQPHNRLSRDQLKSYKEGRRSLDIFRLLPTAGLGCCWIFLLSLFSTDGGREISGGTLQIGAESKINNSHLKVHQRRKKSDFSLKINICVNRQYVLRLL